MQKINTSEINYKLKDRIKKNHLLDKNSWFGIGGCANIFFQPNNKEELILFSITVDRIFFVFLNKISIII